MVSSVLMGIRAYWTNIFCLPRSVIKEIDRLCRHFLWGDPKGGHKIHAISWDKVCSPRKFGGLDLNEGLKWNMASLGKYLWAIMFKQDLYGSI